MLNQLSDPGAPTNRFLIFSFGRVKIVHISCLFLNLLLFNKNTIHKRIYQDFRLVFFFFIINFLFENNLIVYEELSCVILLGLPKNP